jgi:hypothetical protein
VFEVVEGFIGNQSVVSNESAREKSTLMGANDAVEDGFDSVGNGFSNDFEHNIAKGYRSKISRGVGLFIFRNKANVCVINRVRVTTMIQNIKSIVGDVTTYNVPIGLKKFSTQTIRPWGTIAFKLMNS